MAEEGAEGERRGRLLSCAIGLAALALWFGMLWFMFGDVL